MRAIRSYARRHDLHGSPPRRASVAAPAGVCGVRDRRAGAGGRRQHRDVHDGADDRAPSAATPRAGSAPHLQHRPSGNRPSATLSARSRRLRPSQPDARGDRVVLRMERQPHRQRRCRAAHGHARVRQLLRPHRRARAPRTGDTPRRRAAGSGAGEPRHVAAAVRRENGCGRDVNRSQRRDLHRCRDPAAGLRVAGPRRRSRRALFAGYRCTARQPRAGIPAGDRAVEAWHHRRAGGRRSHRDRETPA